MKTSTGCIPCFLRQIKNYSKLLSYSKELENSLSNEIQAQLEIISFKLSPPEIANKLRQIILKHTTVLDPFFELKKESNTEVLAIYSKLKALLEFSSDKLLKSLELAIAGNIIDYGAKHDINLENEIKEILQRCDKYSLEDSQFFDYKGFYKDFAKAENILYIGDNCGEIVFDKLFIEEIIRQYPLKKVTFTVRAKPVINDATYEDAEAVGLADIVTVISSGCDTPGTVLKNASPEFLSKFKQADLIISKGQGNLESLSDCRDPRIYYLFVVKCDVVASHVKADKGTVVLTQYLERKND
ncbi:MAG: ARMT1-like domain-containing protein [Candidatus Margulisbacteria bacterium]|nr:ARMT1-like domain-containing protein [Candidatus Margulisiibacteriota bacterium]